MTATAPALPTTITVTVDGVTRTLNVAPRFAPTDDRYAYEMTTACDANYDTADRFASHPFYGRFPTGNRAHLMTGEFDLVDDATGALASNPRIRVNTRYETCGTDDQGRTWRLRTTLYTHNRNVGRLTGWADRVPADMIAKWR